MPRPLSDQVLSATGGELDAVRGHVLDAAHRVIARHGLAAASTREIAAEAGVGTGTLYNYFDDRLQLLARSIVRRAHILAEPIADLPSRAGRGTVGNNLRYVVGHVTNILDEIVPLIAATFSEPDLLSALHREMTSDDPSTRGTEVIVRYLLAERELGRISPDADCHAAASLIASLCHDRAFQRHVLGNAAKVRLPTEEIDLITLGLTARLP